MNNKWTTPADLVREFRLDKYTDDPKALRAVLVKRMSKLHPDKYVERPRSKTEKEKYYLLHDAIDFLDLYERNSKSLIPVSQLPAIISEISKALAIHSNNEATSVQSKALADFRVRLSHRLVFPRIGSAIFAGIAAFLVAISDKFFDDPILGLLFHNTGIQTLLLVIICYSALLFLLTWTRERRSDAIAEHLMSESALDEVLSNIILIAEARGTPDRVSSIYILQAIRRAAGIYLGPSPSLPALYIDLARRLFFLRPWLDLPTIESAANLQKQRLVERKVLFPMETPSTVSWYRINDEALHDEWK